MTNYLDLTGKAALVTGASSGIGGATARIFAELGASVAIGYHRNQNGAFELRDEISSSGPKVVALKADFQKAQEARSLAEQAQDLLGPIDILVNNAGSLIERKPLLEMTGQTWAAVFELN